MCGCFASSVAVNHMHAWYPQRPEEGAGSPGSGGRQPGAVLWMLGTKARSSGGAPDALNC